MEGGGGTTPREGLGQRRRFGQALALRRGWTSTAADTVSGCVERRCSPAGLSQGKPPYERRDTVGAHLVAASGSRATTRWEIVLISAVAVRQRRVVTMSEWLNPTTRALQML